MPIVQTADISDDDLRALASAGARLGASPFDLLQVLFSESGFEHARINGIGCVGINQFCGSPDQAKSTFALAVPGLTKAQYQALPAGVQLSRYVVPFLSQKPKAAMKSARDIYWVNFYPGTYVPNVPDDHVIMTSHNPDYAGNAVAFDPDHKGFITTGDLQDFITTHTLPSPRYQELASRLSKISPPLAPSLGPGIVIAAATVIGVVLYTKG